VGIVYSTGPTGLVIISSKTKQRFHILAAIAMIYRENTIGG
jgi:hypothetical protein